MSYRAKLLTGMPRRFHVSSAAIFVALLALSATGSYGQTLYGSLTGNITDGTGAAIPRAKVEVLNMGTSLVKTDLTDERGVYLFSDLLPGTYKITISAPAFGSRVKEGAVISLNTVLRVDATLTVSQVVESINVSASVVTLQTDRADINNQIQSTQITDLPLINSQGRNFQELYKVLPGFTPPVEAHSDSGNPQRSMVTQANGMPQSSNNTKLDGATISHPWLPRLVAYLPPVEAVETVNIVSNSFDAEQGMAGGAAMNVTIKIGHQRVSRRRLGVPHQQRSEGPQLFLLPLLLHRRSQPRSEECAEPVRRHVRRPDQEEQAVLLRRLGAHHAPPGRIRACARCPQLPCAQGDFNGTGTTVYDPNTGAADGTGRTPFPNNVIPSNRIDPAAAYMTNLIPAPNQSRCYPNNYLAIGDYALTRDNVDFKINYNPTDKLQMFGRYSFSPTLVFDPPSLGAAGGDATNGGQPGTRSGPDPERRHRRNIHGVANRAGGWRDRLHPPARWARRTSIIDKNYGLDVLKIPGTNGTDPLQGGYPRFTFNTFSSLGNPNVSNPFLFRDNQYVTNCEPQLDQGRAFAPLRIRVQQVRHQSLPAAGFQRSARRLQLHRRPDVAQRRRRPPPATTVGAIPAGPAARPWARTSSI